MSGVAVAPDPAHPAGHALVRVAGAASFVSQPGFRVQRDAGWGDDKLGPGGWQSSDALLLPARAEASGPDLLLHVGWDVCQHLEAGVYELSVPAAGVEPTGVFWPEIVPLHSGTASVATPAPLLPPAPKLPDADAAVVAAPKPPVAAVAPVLPGPLPDVASGSNRAALLGVAGLLVLLLVAGAAYHTLRGGGVEPQVVAAPPALPVPTPPPALPPDPLPAPAAAGLGGLSVPDVIAKAPDTAAIRAEGEQRLSGDRKDDGLLLLEAAADRSDATAAAALARLYDPVVFQAGGPIPRADARQAARYYRDAARGGEDVAAARDALRRLLQTQAQGGNMGADLMLKDFWP